MEVLSIDEIKERLSQMEGWVLSLEEGTYITKEFDTKNWKTTMFVVNAIASLAESQWHHPDLEIGFKKIRVKLTTHEAGGITDRDFRLARSIDEIVRLVLNPPKP